MIASGCALTHTLGWAVSVLGEASSMVRVVRDRVVHENRDYFQSNATTASMDGEYIPTMAEWMVLHVSRPNTD